MLILLVFNLFIYIYKYLLDGRFLIKNLRQYHTNVDNIKLSM